MVYKCKVCGGQTTIDSNSGIVICDYCGTKQALPLFTEDSEKLLYESGNNYLLHNEYDKAENVFNQLLTIKPNAAELYWDLVLCKYGVTYVKDPKTEKYIPTCNRTHYTPIFSDKNYQKAIELSTGEKKALFEEDAKTIDNIQKGIIAVSKKEKPFDIFISYKETDANGNRTKDSIEAQKLYEKLTEAGYKVFFSRITLEDKVGTEYEPYIYAALYSSKVMLTICSSKENIEAVWVKNEWSRFLSLRQNDTSKTVLPLYFDMEKEELPDEFALLASYDMKADGFEDELLRGIKKLIPLPIMKAKRRKLILKTTSITLATIILIVGIAAAIIVPKELEQRRIKAEEAALIAANEEAYQSAMTLFDSADYTAAEKAFKELGDYKDSSHMAERCPIQPDYDAAIKLYYDGRYAEASWAFKELGDYEDSADMQKKSENSWRNDLSTIITDNYYITDNGTVNTLKGKSGNAHSKIDISKDGKITSIKSNSFYTDYYSDLVALHENGQVSHPLLDGKVSDDSDLDNIIKVSDALNSTMGVIGLRADGKMVSFYQKDDYNFGYLDDLSTWSDIVDFKHNFHQANGLTPGLIVGLKSDGSLCAIQVASGELQYVSNPFNMNEINGILSQFSNVKRFAINSQGSQGMYGFALVALTNDNKLLTYTNGEFSEFDGSDICDVIAPEIVLKTNGDLVELNSDKILMRDVVKAEEFSSSDSYGYYVVTRSGNINFLLADTSQENAYKTNQTENKTPVCDEWLSRLD